jgi:hypothetical protein
MVVWFIAMVAQLLQPLSLGRGFLCTLDLLNRFICDL